MKNKLFLMATVLVLVVAVVVSLVACDSDKPKEYTYGDWTVTLVPTDTTQGTAVRVSSDGGEDITFTLPVLTDAAYTITAPTCTEAGSATITADEIGTITITLPALEHNYVFDSFVWDGYTAQAKYVCANNAAHVVLYDAEVVSEVTTPATYEAAGVRTYTATYQGNTDTKTEAIAALQHNYQFVGFEWEGYTAKAKFAEAADENDVVLYDAIVTNAVTTEATCTTAGVRTYTATYDGHTDTKTEAIAALEHAYAFAGFVWDGYTAQAKFVCGNDDEHVLFYDAEITSEVTTPATYEADGVRTYTATYENYTDAKTEVIPALVHDYQFDSFVWDEYSAVAKYVDANNAEFVLEYEAEVTSEVTTAATCTKDGVRTYTATYEGNTDTKTEVIPALEHNYAFDSFVWDGYTAQAKYVCGNDAEHIVYYQAEVTSEVTTEATCTENGERTYTATYEGNTDTATEVIPAAHSYEFVEFVWDGITAQAKYVCSVCEDEAFFDAEVSGPVTTPATYNEAGNNAYTATYEGNEDVLNVPIAKLVAPYDNKTYAAIVRVRGDGDYKVISSGDIYPTAGSEGSVTLGANGTGTGSGWPAAGENSVVMVDATTGEVLVNLYSASGKKGFVDFETGVIVCQAWSDFEAVYVLAPAAYTSITGSSWTTGMTFDYETETATYSILVQGDRVYFGVTRTDLEGNTVAASDAYSADVVVYSIDDEEIITLANNGNDMVVADGLQGVYTAEDSKVLVLSGCGIAVFAGADGEYEVQDGYVDVYVEGTHYEVILDGTAFSYTYPTVTISFDTDGKAEVEAADANTKVPFVFPVPTNAGYVFMGWAYEDGTLVEGEYLPTEDITFYAVWQPKVSISLNGVLAGDDDVVVIPEGGVLSDYLPAYTVDEVNFKKFEGWYLEDIFETAINLDYEVTAEDNGAELYAKWADLPAYYGSYRGKEIWYKDAGYSASAGSYSDFSFDSEGASSGWRTYNVVSYDPATQALVYTSGNSTRTAYYDAESGVFVDDYNTNNVIGYDIYLFVKNGADVPINGHIGLYYRNGAANSSYYTRFVELADGRIVLLSDNKIYLVTVTNALGEALNTVAAIKASNSAIAYNTSGDVVLAICTSTSSFDNQTSSSISALDKYLGTYTLAEADDLVIDGNGGFVWGSKSGRYTEAEDTYTLDAYVVSGGKDVEYIQITLNGSTYTYVKPTVTVSFVVPNGNTAIEAVEVNINVEATLPSGEDEGYVFNGYFTDAEFENALESTVFTEDTTLYAKYSAPAVLTITYNNGADDEVITYSVGDTTAIDTPVWAKHKFLGWFTTSTFDEGSEWENGTISANAHIYGKWTDAEAYYNVYNYPLYISVAYNGYLSTNGNFDGCWSIDPDGNATLTGGEPSGITGDFVIENYNKATGTFEAVQGSSRHAGLIDVATGIMFIDYSSSNASLTGAFAAYLFSPFESSSFASKVKGSSNRDTGTAWLSYTTDGNTYNYMIKGGVLYTGLTFEKENGDAIDADKIATSNDIVNVKKDAILVAAFGKAGGSLVVELDGLQGTYTRDDNTITLNGNGGISITDAIVGEEPVTGTYTEDGDNLLVYAADNTVYVEITLSGDAYTIVKPMVNIDFEKNGFNPTDTFKNGATVNKNIAYTLPVYESNTQVFYGWYVEGDEDTILTSIVPTADATYKIKWAAKVVLTVVYGNGLDNATFAFGTGDTVVVPTPAITDGKAFDHWYLSGDNGETEDEVYTPGTITADTTIYAAWVEAPFEVLNGYYTDEDAASLSSTIFAFEEKDGTYITANAGVNSSKSFITFKFFKNGTFIFHYAGGSENNYDWLRVYLNNSAYSASSANAKYSISGLDKSGDCEISVSAGDYIAIVYSKDSGGNGGADKYTLSNISFEPAAVAVITLDANGVTPNEELETIDTYVGELTTLPSLTSEDYYFQGWYVEGAEDVVYIGTYAPSDATVTLLAKWISKDSVPDYEVYLGQSTPYASATANPWTDNGDGTYTSGGKGIGSANSYICFYFYGAGTFSFTLNGSSESGWDGIIISNGTAATDTRPSTDYSGTVTDKAESYEVAAGSYVSILFRKDGSGNNGADQYTISNIAFVAA